MKDKAKIVPQDNDRRRRALRQSPLRKFSPRHGPRRLGSAPRLSSLRPFSDAPAFPRASAALMRLISDESDSSAPRFSNPAFRPPRAPRLNAGENRPKSAVQTRRARPNDTRRFLPSFPRGASVLRPLGSALLTFRAAFPARIPDRFPSARSASELCAAQATSALSSLHRSTPHPPPPDAPAPARIESPPKPRRSAPRNVLRQAQRPSQKHRERPKSRVRPPRAQSMPLFRLLPVPAVPRLQKSAVPGHTAVD